MVVRTWRQCTKVVSPELVYVATDDDRIRTTCEDQGIQVIMTSHDCLTGTDRLAEASRQVVAQVYINVQGDEPVFNPCDLKILIDEATKNPTEILNGVCEISSDSQFRSYSVPKVVMRQDGRLLYMSRGPIPASKANSFNRAWRQVCAYAFPKEALEAFSAHPSKTALEKIEDIEILRFLELGWQVRMIPMSATSIAVDNPEDVGVAEAAIKEQG